MKKMNGIFCAGVLDTNKTGRYNDHSLTLYRNFLVIYCGSNTGTVIEVGPALVKSELAV
jgi:hypothetical protein